MRNSYDLAHHVFRSRATPIYGDIYALSDLVDRFEVVIVGQILVHLRDPLAALEQATRGCRDTLIITEGMFADAGAYPLAVYLGSSVPYGWWRLSLPIYRHVLKCYGFTIISESSARYPCSLSGEEILTTIVAKREKPLDPLSAKRRLPLSLIERLRSLKRRLQS